MDIFFIFLAIQSGRLGKGLIILAVYFFGYSPILTTTRKGNNERKYSQNINPKFRSKKCYCIGTKNADAPGASPRHYGAPVARAVV